MKYRSSKEIYNKRYKRLRITKNIIAAIVIVIVLSFFIDVIKFLLIAAFVAANSMLLSLDRRFQMPVDVEFSTFSAVLCTSQYGLGWGIFAAIVTKVGAMLYNANIRADHFFMIFGYCIAALITFVLSPFLDVVAVGMISVIIVNIYIVFVSRYITNLYPFEILLYGVSNFLFNLLLFMLLTQPVLFIMGIGR